MVSGAGNIGDVRSAQQYFFDRMLMDELPTCFRYAGTMVGDAAPAASELFLNGERNSRLYLPPNSFLMARFIGAAWNVTNKTIGGCQTDVGIQSVDNVISFSPTNLSGADGNPVTLRNVTPAGTFALVADNTNKALRVNFTPVANAKVRVSGVLYFAFVAATTQFPNDIRQVN